MAENMTSNKGGKGDYWRDRPAPKHSKPTSSATPATKSQWGHSHGQSSDIGPSRVNVAQDMRKSAPHLSASAAKSPTVKSPVAKPKMLAGAGNDRMANKTGNLNNSSPPNVRKVGTANKTMSASARKLGGKR